MVNLPGACTFGSYVIKGAPYLTVMGINAVDKELTDCINLATTIEADMTIDSSYYYGFRQLMEVAVKALSPGINDPGTAVASLQALGSLLACRMKQHPQNHFADSTGKTRIITAEKSFDEVFALAVLPIWDYGKDDRVVQQAFHNILTQLQYRGSYKSINNLLQVVEKAMAEKQDSLLITTTGKDQKQ